MPRRPRHGLLRRHAPWLAVLLGFVGSRVLYTELGLALDDEPLGYFWQYLDPVELRDRLLESVLYQHTQPPLYNLYLGLGLKTDTPLLFFRATALAFGLTLHLALYTLARRLSVRAWLASASAVAFAISPASILMETWLFYTYPVASLVALSAALLHRGLESRRRGATLALAFAAMALIVETRSLFHVAWMIAVVGLVLLVTRHRARALALALVPLALAGAVYAKNWVLFGRPVASTWMGFSLSRLTTTRLSPLERDAWMAEGALSELADDPPWLPLERYPRGLRTPSEREVSGGDERASSGQAESALRGLPPLPVLAEARRSNGEPNFNHAAYVHIADLYAHDARVVLERAPEVWWESTQEAWRLHWLPIHDYTFFHARRRAAGPWMRRIESAYELASGSGFAAWSWEQPMPPFEERPGWLGAALTGLALVLALGEAVQRRQARATRIALLYCVLTVLFVAVVGNSLELGENQRFRFLSEPLSWALVTLLLERTLGVGARTLRGLRGRVRRWRARGGAREQATQAATS